eukprot:6210932-Pleurochrysis_carterae.AAC.3
MKTVNASTVDPARNVPAATARFRSSRRVVSSRLDTPGQMAILRGSPPPHERRELKRTFSLVYRRDVQRHACIFTDPCEKQSRQC